MQVLHDIEQGSDEWDKVRGVIPTASKFDKILTPTGKRSTQDIVYMNELLAHWLMGHGDLRDGFTSWDMQRGMDLEAEALAYYEMLHGDLTRVGFCLRDDGIAGCSPDSLIGDWGGLELKCPKAHTHVDYLLRQKLPTKYIVQVQGSMWITDRQWWDFMSYHPEMDPLIVRVNRDDIYIEKLARSVISFHERMQAGRLELIEKGLYHGEKRLQQNN